MKRWAAWGSKQATFWSRPCGVGNFFDAAGGNVRFRLYGVELDSISGRIAQQLYPHAEITVGGFETTDRRDF